MKKHDHVVGIIPTLSLGTEPWPILAVATDKSVSKLQPLKVFSSFVCHYCPACGKKIPKKDRITEYFSCTLKELK